MFLFYNHDLLSRAKELRTHMTPQERKLWYRFLRNHPLRFTRQKIIEDFIVDFYCSKAKLIIELDGSQHYTREGIEYDLERSGLLTKYSLKVIRFTNNAVDLDFQNVCSSIDRIIKERTENHHHPSVSCASARLADSSPIRGAETLSTFFLMLTRDSTYTNGRTLQCLVPPCRGMSVSIAN